GERAAEDGHSLARELRELLRCPGRDPRRAARQDDLAGTVHSLDPRLGQRARRELGLDGPARDERDAEAREHGAPHRLLEPELEPEVEVADPDAEAAELVVNDPTHARALLHDDER